MFTAYPAPYPPVKTRRYLNVALDTPHLKCSLQPRSTGVQPLRRTSSGWFMPAGTLLPLPTTAAPSTTDRCRRNAGRCLACDDAGCATPRNRDLVDVGDLCLLRTDAAPSRTRSHLVPQRPPARCPDTTTHSVSEPHQTAVGHTPARRRTLRKANTRPSTSDGDMLVQHRESHVTEQRRQDRPLRFPAARNNRPHRGWPTVKPSPAPRRACPRLARTRSKKDEMRYLVEASLMSPSTTHSI